MNLVKYCKDQKMDLHQYEMFEQNIKNIAIAIKETYCSMYKKDTGIYYEINILFNTSILNEIHYFVIDELKKIGFEFIENYTYFRY
jgi:hypothetical protein